MTSRQMALNVFFMRFGHHKEAWRHPTSTGTGRPDVQWWIDAARMAEAAKFDAFFLADFIGRPSNFTTQPGETGANFQFEPLTLLSAIAVATQHIGLVATMNTNWEDPYNLARRFASLDHISGGRAGWNVVSSLNPASALNFGLKEELTHDERYRRAAEFVDLAKQLWDSYEDEAFDHPRRDDRVFVEASATHPVHFEGEFFSSDGLLDVPRPIQGYPVFVQAGNSDTGREFAAQIAEMTYASAQSLDVAQEYYRDVKARMAKYGRDEDQMKVTPGLSVVVAESDGEAQDRFGELQELVDFSQLNLGLIDLSGFPLDEPLPDIPFEAGPNGLGRFQQALELARRDNLTVRQLVLRFMIARGHLQAIGSVKTVADVMEEWFVEGGADGFNVVPPYLPSGFEDFARLVVPELQRRGLFRTEYTGSTFRENLGLRQPENQHGRVSV
jgi:FMN-dependent oxidoreductase (nitrilotriacetate monooxygenase family)